MATTSTTLSKTKIVVNAYGNSTDGIAPHFRLLIDGKDAGQASVSSTDAKSYTFDTDVVAGQAHKIQIVYDNDDIAAGQDRDLGIKSLVVNGTTLNPTSATYERYDDGATTTTMPGQEGLWWNGSLTFSTPGDLYAASTSGSAPAVTAPAAIPEAGSAVSGSTGSTDAGSGSSGSSTIVINAKGVAAGGQNAHFTVLADGQKIGGGTVGTDAHDYTFKTDLAADQAHKIQIQYDNDGVVSGTDRNLHVGSVTINGHAVSSTDSSVSYDKGTLDGNDVVKGQSDLWWNGTLQVNADKALFTSDSGSGSSGSSGTTTPAAPTTPTTPTTGTGSTGSGTSNTATGIADGYLHTEGSQIIDSAGNAVKLTGVNWFGAEGYAFAPQGLWQDSYQHIMDQMLKEGFNTIRLPWSDAMLDSGRMPTGIDYSKNPDLQGKTSLEVFDKIIDYADKTGMKIILDHHRSGDGASANENGLWYTDQYPESKMIANWKMLAERYADNPSVVAADLHNEPHGQATWGDGNQATDWHAAAERIGDAIQTVNKNWLMIVEGVEQYNGNTYWWGGNLQGVQDHPVDLTVDNKLVYSVHDYPPSMAGFGWFGDSNFPNNMDDVWTKNWGYVVQKNIAPVLVGEFGTKLESSQDQQWLSSMVKYMDGDYNLDGKSDLAAGHEGVSWTYWAWSPGSGDTGGIMTDDWSINQSKMTALQPALFDGGTH
ncbi:cellulase family glycosylhydrolase [Azospirillum canadense]|uniref:cellulase family glycosylhydrolase n=1 Tax=Azospirillum canadense TaxID=403962 RepID=UPI0022270025|nr:carbohydrate-binding domain-containing protein [Azospirillum canadense]MCW2240184.1 endoglucanase [Azospirillum canadense]